MPRKILINFANYNFYSAQERNSISGFSIGNFHEVIQYRPKDIDRRFLQLNKDILSHKRGAGYWLWKPYFIRKTLIELQFGDYLCYSDSASYFINPIDSLIEVCEESGQSILPFELFFPEKKYTKRDALILINVDRPEITETKQRLADCILFKKTPETIAWVEEYLHYGQDPSAITDIPNQLGFPNYPEFIEHRHDQSIFSLLTKKYHFQAFRDPSQWGNGKEKQYPESKYLQLVHNTRRKDRRWLRTFNMLRERVETPLSRKN